MRNSGEDVQLSNDSGGSEHSDVQIGNVSTSLEIVQELFKQFTIKSNKLAKIYPNNVVISGDDICRLHQSILEAFRVFKIETASLFSQIYYGDGTNVRHNSPNDLLDSASKQSAETESVLLQYNFLMSIPNTKELQKCELSIRMISRMVIEKKIESELGSNPAKLMLSLMVRAVIVEIDHGNIIVATSISSIIDKWVSTLHQNELSMTMKFLKLRSSSIPIILARISAIAAALVCLNQATDIGAELDQYIKIATWITFSFVVILMSHTISRALGQYIEYRIDAWSPLSYISLTKMDEISVKKKINEQKKGVLMSTLSLIASLPSTIFIKIITDHLLRMLG